MKHKQEQIKYLYRMAEKYIWWKSADEALKYPLKIVCQVMNIGVFDDVHDLKFIFSENKLRRAVIESEPGQLSEKAKSFWFCVLDIPNDVQLKTRFDL